MNDVYQRGAELLLPSKRRVVVCSVKREVLLCQYVQPAKGALKLGDEVTLTKLFAVRHCDLLQAGGAAG